MQTFGEFITKLRGELWPSGEARSLVANHTALFKSAMLDIQNWVPCVRNFNVSTWNFADTNWEDAKTVVNAPWGIIKEVYTVAGGQDRWRDKVRYRSSTYKEIKCWSSNLYCASTPTSPILSGIYPQGTRASHVSQDSPYGRARIGIWAIDRHRLYLAPYIQSTEMIVVVWDGIKTRWQESDGVDETYWTEDYEDAVKNWVMWKHEHFYSRDRAAAKDAKDSYDSILADLIYRCRERTKQQYDSACDSSSGGSELVGLSQDTLGDDDDSSDPDTTDEDNVLFDYVGDAGEDSAEAIALGVAMESDNPEFVVLGGDLNYGSGYATDLAHFGWAKEDGLIIPVVGNHDWDAGTDLDQYLAFFADELEGKNNGRYYDFIHGPLHGFVLDLDAREPDGRSITSTQHEWMYAKSFLSVARWKFAFGHQPPYSSGSTYGSNATLQWDFAAMGIQIGFFSHEHNFEHMLIGGVHYFNCGLGGKSRYAFGAAISGSLFRYNALEARLRVRLDCDECTVELVTTAGDIIYTYTIAHPLAE